MRNGSQERKGVGATEATEAATTEAAATEPGATEAAARVWAIEYAPVRINVVVPGIIDTEVWDEILPPDAKRAQFEAIESSLPVGRVGTPDDVAKAVEFLITNDFVTGTAIEIDGGHRIS